MLNATDIKAGQTFYKRSCAEITVIGPVGFRSFLVSTSNPELRNIIANRWPDMLMPPEDIVALVRCLENDLNKGKNAHKERYFVMKMGNDLFTARLGYDFNAVLHMELFSVYESKKTFYSSTGYWSYFAGLVSRKEATEFLQVGRDYIEKGLNKFFSIPEKPHATQLELFCA